jgi:hypothetical protein
VVEPAPNDLILRTVATKLVRIALQCDALTAEMYLIDHMARLPSDGWRARFWSPQFEATPGGVLWPLSLSEEFIKILKNRFWPETRNVQNGALIQINGSFAAYVGPLLMTSDWTEITSQKGIILPRSALVPSNIRWWTEIHLSVIRLPLSPLVKALRDDGGYVDMALAQLVEEGLLPAALVGTRSSSVPIIPSNPMASETKGPLKYRVPAVLNKTSPLPGEGYEDWARRALPSANPHSVATILSTNKDNKDQWKKGGGATPKRGRKPPLDYPR